MIQPDDNENTLNIPQFLFRMIFLCFLDAVKSAKGQQIKRTLLNIFYYFFFLLTTGLKIYDEKQKQQQFIIQFNPKSDLFFFFILAFNISELISWEFIGSALNSQAIDSINIKFIISELRDFIAIFFIVLILCIILIFLPIYQKFVKIGKIINLVRIIHFIILFSFILSIIHDFQGNNNISLFESSDIYLKSLKIMLHNIFNQREEVLSTRVTLKNLIFLFIESYPNEFVSDSKISPNLNNLSKRFEFIGPINPQPYTTWSMSGLLVTETGLPQIFPDTTWSELSTWKDYKYVTGIKGIPNILKSYNYTLNYINTGDDNIMGFGTWIDEHHFNRVYRGKNDLYTYNFVIEKYLPELDYIARNSKNNMNLSMSLIYNMNTHTPYKRPRWCKLNFHPDIEEKQKCFACVDDCIGRVVKKFLDLKMYEHTILAVFPDHAPFYTNYKEIFILFPGIEKIDPKFKVKDEITYYDLPPTIIDLLGIVDYKPEFVFGRNIYLMTNNNHDTFCLDKNNCIKKHKKPDVTDLAFLYKFYHFEQGKDIKGGYNLSDTFRCRASGSDKNYYYSSKPCFGDAKGGNNINF